LDISKCRISVAAKAGFRDTRAGELRVASTFVNIAKAHFDKQNREIDIIKLNGSVELAPLLGLSDVIVDLVSTGKTLQDNGMVEVETIAEVSQRLIANKVGYKFKYEAISRLVSAVRRIIQ
jgi:ATP phosphoribosyltransferase